MLQPRSSSKCYSDSQRNVERWWSQNILSRDWCWSCWDVPLCSIGSWNLFHYQKLLVKKYGNKDDQLLPTYLTLSLGAFSGSFAATIVYPVNLLRTRLQSQGTYAHPFRYEGFYDVFSKTVAREGYSGLWKGLVPNLAKVAPAVSISYFVYESLIRRF